MLLAVRRNPGKHPDRPSMLAHLRGGLNDEGIPAFMARESESPWLTGIDLNGQATTPERLRQLHEQSARHWHDQPSVVVKLLD